MSAEPVDPKLLEQIKASWGYKEDTPPSRRTMPSCDPRKLAQEARAHIETSRRSSLTLAPCCQVVIHNLADALDAVADERDDAIRDSKAHNEAYFACNDDRSRLQAENERLRDLLDTAWGIICNAGQGDWEREHLDWQDAAKRFCTNYFAALRENHGKQ